MQQYINVHGNMYVMYLDHESLIGHLTATFCVKRRPVQDDSATIA